MIQSLIPPSAKDMEEAVIASIMLEPQTIFEVADTITPEMFYDNLLADIYRFMVSASQSGAAFDYVSASRYLIETNRKDQIIRLSEITAKIVSTTMVQRHAMVIKEKYLLRRYLGLSADIAQFVGDGKDLAEVSSMAGVAVMELTGNTERKEPRQIGKVIDDVINEIGKIQNREISLSGVPSGFTELDRATGGWKQGELIIIAARPSIGKTALAAQLAYNAADFNKPVGFFSLEMSSEEVARRYLSGATGMTNTQLLTGNCVSVEKLVEDTGQFTKMGIYVDDTGAMTLMEIKSKARRLIMRYGIELILIDYLQLMRGSNPKSREQEVSELSRGLKAIAKELRIPVIVLSQLNRQCEDRANKKPFLSDLRDSGAIEQDADIVLLLTRPAYYNMPNFTIGGMVKDSAGALVVDIAKNRNGGTGEIVLKHNQSLTKITDETTNENWF